MEIAVAVASTSSSPRFTGLEQQNLRAIIFRVLPSDDGCGAREAGADDYVLGVIETRSGPATVRDLKSGLGMLEDLARQGGGKSFWELPEGEQDATLRQLQLVPHPTLQRFFRRLVALTLEGFLCDPKRGGNRNAAGWIYLDIQGARRPEACLEEDPCTTS